MTTILRATRRRDRFGRLPTRVLIGIVLACGEAALLASALVYVGVELWSAEREATYTEGHRVVPGVTVGGESMSGVDADQLMLRLRTRSKLWLDAPFLLEAPGFRFETTPRAMGAVMERSVAFEEAMHWGRDSLLPDRVQARLDARTEGHDVPLRSAFDPQRARVVLEMIAPAIERAPVAGRVDLEARAFRPASPARGLLIPETIPRVALALARGESRAVLAVYEESLPRVENEQQDFPEIGEIVGEFETSYRVTESGLTANRAENLRLAAAALDGTVIAPGGHFSFNQVVGERSASAGYLMAPGIHAGELVEVLGGGVCQIASTLFAAGFFAGLEIIQVRPHSRPSNYIDMGLDATVVWPDVDLVLSNPYDFPVVLHVTSNGGSVRAQILGKKRDFRVAFERTIRGVQDFPVEERPDADALLGSTRLMQQGVRGFSLTRMRKIYRDEALERTEQWSVNYPATTEIVAVGQNPLGLAPKPRARAQLREPEPVLRIFR